MGVKVEVTWKRRSADGSRVEVNARRVGNEWRFYSRSRRFEKWEPFGLPPLEDWLALLDAVERRAARRLHRPAEVKQLRATIQRRFPEAAL